ncbi:MAG: SPOR domain-containing protein [Paracoccaceae bacterium]
MVKARFGAFGLALVAGVVLAGCQDGQQPFGFLKKKPAENTAEGAAQSVELIDRDVEAPEVFQANETGLWDGRPSLGGVWVAFPDVADPERVIVRNPENGKFVIGALFKREREMPGPRLQVSSDAAAALGMLAGQPAELNVTALRREEAPALALDASNPILDTAETIESEALDPVVEQAGAAIDAAEGKTTETAAAETAAPAAAPATSPAKPSKPYVQLGIFSTEANAKRAVDMMTKVGVAAAIKTESVQGKTFWRVTAGPAEGPDGRQALLDKVKAQGFADAYFVSN